MTILPDAPIDTFTGLKQPTIVFGGDEGVSLIRDDGTVSTFKTSSQVAYDGTRRTDNVDFAPDGRLTWTSKPNNPDHPGIVITNTRADRIDSFNTRYSWVSDSMLIANDGVIYNCTEYDHNTLNSAPDENKLITGYWAKPDPSREINDVLMIDNDTVAIATNARDRYQYDQRVVPCEGLSLVRPDINSSMACNIAHDHNTGWMPGKSTIVTICDTTSLGESETIGVDEVTELVTDQSNWANVGDSDWTVTSVNSLQISTVVPSGAAAKCVYQGLDPKKQYIISFSIDHLAGGTNTMAVIINDGTYATIDTIDDENASFFTTGGTHSVIFSGASSAGFILWQGRTCTLSNISIKETGELLVNGDFNNDYVNAGEIAGWKMYDNNNYNADTTLVNGVLTITENNSNNYGILTQRVYLEAYQQYVLDCTYAAPGAGYASFFSGIGGGNSYVATTRNYGGSTAQTRSISLRPEASGYYWVSIAATGDIGATAEFHNISLRRGVRSYSNDYLTTGFQIVGKVERYPVNTGSEMMMFRGLDKDNYLINNDNAFDPHEFHDQDFMVMMWLRTDNSSGSPYVLGWGQNNSSADPRWGVRFKYDQLDANSIAFNVSGTSVLGVANASPNAHQQHKWTHVCFKRVDNILYGYVNGLLRGSVGLSTVFYNEGCSLKVGNWTLGAHSFDGDVSMLRIAKGNGTMPSHEQIRQIHNDESALFHFDSKCTLIGNNTDHDKITALAHDPVTGLLHAGSSRGRSTFSGLRRVDSNDQPITTTISSYNELIVEQ
jgi:hypothetical protein